MLAETEPEARASDYLWEHRQDFQIDPDRDLELREIRSIGNLASVRFQQKIGGIPVRGAVVTVNVDLAGGTVLSAASNFDQEALVALPDTQPEISFDAAVERAVDSVRRDLPPAAPELSLEPFEDGDHGPTLLRPSRYFPLFDEQRWPRIPRHEERASHPLAWSSGDSFAPALSGELHLAWRVVVEVGLPPLGTFEVFIDALTGERLGARDLLRRSPPSMLRPAKGRGRVFVPDPATSSGDPNLRSNRKGKLYPPRIFDRLLEPVDLLGLDQPIGGRYRLWGELFRIRDIQKPNDPHPTEMTRDFLYWSSDPHLLATMAYYWLDTAGRYLRDQLELASWPKRPLDVDPQARRNAQGSYFDPNPKRRRILLGRGWHPDAADAAVILHELGHYIQHFQGFQGPEDLEEGWADAFSRIFLDRFAPSRREPHLVFPFDSNRHYKDRRVDKPFRYGYSLFSSLKGRNGKGTAWASTVWKVFEALGGTSEDLRERKWAADVTIRLHLGANVAFGNVPLRSSRDYGAHQRMAEAMLVAATTLGNAKLVPSGLLLNVLRQTFADWGLVTRFADVNIDSFENGGRDSVEAMIHHENPRLGVNLKDARFWVRVRKASGRAPSRTRVRAFTSRNDTSCFWPEGLEPLGEELVSEWPEEHMEQWLSFPFDSDSSGMQLLVAIIDTEEDPSVVNFLTPDDRVGIEQLAKFDNNITLHRVTSPL